MKKLNLILIGIFFFFIANGQNYRIGLRFSPLQSHYFLDNYSETSNSTLITRDDYTNQFDSIGISLFMDKYNPNKDYFIRAEFGFGKIVNKSNRIIEYSQTKDFDKESHEFNQWVYNLNLGIGTRTDLKKFKLYFGAYLPLTFLPKGKYVSNTEQYNNGTLNIKSEGNAVYHASFGFGIGSFAGISTTINNKISIGVDFSYQLCYISRNIDNQIVRKYYNTTPTTYIEEDEIKIGNYYASKITPTIIISYNLNFASKKNIPSE